MKLALFTQNLCAGGVQKNVKTLVEYFKDKCEIFVILAEDNKEDFYSLDVPIYRIKTPQININEEGIGEWLLSYRASELTKILDEHRIDSILSLEDYNNLILLRTQLSYNPRKIISVRCSIKDNYSKPVHLLDKEYYLKEIPELYQKADSIICVSAHIQKELENMGIASTLIYNGITPNPLEPSNENLIINVGRLHPQKGQGDLIWVLGALKNEIDANVVLVGDGPLEAELKALARDFDIYERVEFAGFCDPAPFIKRAKLAVMPSYYEGFSNAALELMAANRPVLAYDYAGANEIFDEQGLVSLGDTYWLALRIKELLSDENKLNELRERQFETTKRFSLDKMLSSYKEVLLESN